ncbi:MAG: glutamate synthase large subunit [Paludibacteraceae bacterium]|nr:glutamate synthase large subunit [Paludibacteraceae bacterium]
MQQGLYNSESEHDACGVGLLVNLHGQKSHDLVEHALKVLEHMVHRGAERPDQTGDGAGILIQIPHAFLENQLGHRLPAGRYGTGLVFLPRETEEQERVLNMLREAAESYALQLSDVRDVPVNDAVLGADAARTQPAIRQVVLTSITEEKDSVESLERRLYLTRKKVEQWIMQAPSADSEQAPSASSGQAPSAGSGQAEQSHQRDCYFVSLSSKTMVYKGMLSSDQLRLYYPDLMHPLLTSAIALVHSRFSTNTFPTWALAQPFRLIGHNGEINTIRGNRRWMEARESVLQPAHFTMESVRPVLQPGMSDSASLDNVLEFFVMTGMSLPHALAMMVPESYNQKNPISPALKSFYEYHSILMEAWDGPATLLFSDGRYAGGLLDRNGLRPARYVLTQHDTLIIASETGVLNLPIDNVKKLGRLRPGKMLLVDTETGRILYDKEIKEQLARMQPYGDWLALNRINLKDVSSGRKVKQEVDDMPYKMRAFGYRKEDVQGTILPMVQNSQEPSASMGNDTPLAAFSRQPQLLFNYFRQQFAQVTNPPIDPIREELVMDISSYIGQISHNLLEPDPVLCKMVESNNPIITNREMDLLRNLSYKGFRTRDIDLTFAGDAKIADEVERICREAEEAVSNGYNYLVLTDKGLCGDRLAVPSLLATSAVHNYLIEKRKRVQTAILVEAGDVREVMHFALLMGYGASAVCPYMAMAIIHGLCQDGTVQLDFPTAEKHYIKAVNKGLKKILSKMGISTMGSYKGAGLFEAVGLNEDLLDRYFSGTRSSFSGVGLERICEDMKRMADAPSTGSGQAPSAGSGQAHSTGSGQVENEKTQHAWTPEAVRLLQKAVQDNDYEAYRAFARLSDEKKEPIFIRDLMKTRNTSDPSTPSTPHPSFPLRGTEGGFYSRLVAGAISFGAISREAHETIATAMNRIGGRSNTGEGGEDSARFGTETNSRIKQVASGRFGVTAEYLMNADEIQIKVAQGAKPGEGGQLPGFKVDEVIARTRHSIPGITLISPPPHHDIYSIEDLAQLIFDLKCLNPDAMVSVKLVAEAGVGTIAAGVAKAKADNIVISGGCGGTGASPAGSIRHTGMPAEIGLAEAQQTLLLNGLRGKVTLQVDGQLKTGRDIIIMALLGAEEYGFATALMVCEGCKLCRQCHTNKCPAGIATQDPEKRKRFAGKAEYIERYAAFLQRDVEERLAEMGVASLADIIGRTDLLEVTTDRFDLSKLLYRPELRADQGTTKTERQSVESRLNDRLNKECASAVAQQRPTYLMHQILNTDRAIGAGIAGAVARRYGAAGLPDKTIQVDFYGSAGQSFGAFLTGGIEFRLHGDANDYVGKSLSGGRIVIVPPDRHSFAPEQNIIAGNTILYGATSGEMYVNGQVGERFAVRNSGAEAVVEGVGDHCCEYMTGGRVVVLGQTGRNFAAGMSGGIAYVWNEQGDFDFFCNMEHVELTLVDAEADEEELLRLIRNHVSHTASPLAQRILADWEKSKQQFIKVMPVEYKQILLRGE